MATSTFCLPINSPPNENPKETLQVLLYSALQAAGHVELFFR